MVDQVQT
jgi:hypothetical protein